MCVADRSTLTLLLFIELDSSGALEAYFGTTIPDELFFQESTR